MAFIVGDKVKIASFTEDKEYAGRIGTVVNFEYDDDEDEYPYSVEFDNGDYSYSAPKELLLPNKNEKPKKVNYLLKYDLDEDPVEEFETLDEVKERVKYLYENEDSLKKDSIVVYEVVKKFKVNVETKISIK